MSLNNRMVSVATALIPLRNKAYTIKHLGYSGIEKIDALIDRDDFAFLIGVISDYGVSALRAWSLPYELKRRLGTLSSKKISMMSESQLEQVLRHPSNLHRFPKQIARFTLDASNRIACQYNGITSNIWRNTESAREIKANFLQFKGIGPKKAEMATKILVRDKNLKLNDLWSVGLAPDVHVWRVLYRLGNIVSANPGTTEELVRVGKLLKPDYPAEFDDALWMLGRDICRPTNPLCLQCPLNILCQKVDVLKSPN